MKTFKNYRYQSLKYLNLLREQIELNPINELGLFSGELGKVLYYFYYGNTLMQEKYIKKGGALLNHVILEIENGNAHYMKNGSLSRGIAGLGMTIEILVNEGFIEDEFEPLLTSFDRFVFSEAEKQLKSSHSDFMHAGFGSILYLFYRVDKNDTVKIYLEKLLNIVKDGLVYISEGVAYIPNKYLDEAAGYKDIVSIGLAHGQIGKAHILLKFVEKGIFSSLATSILQPLLRFILRLYNSDAKEEDSYFPYFYNLQKHSSENYYTKSIRWCYGDMSALHLLLVLTKVFPSSDLEEKINLLSKKILAIKDINEAGCNYTILCHGTLGNAYYFKKLFDLSENSDYYDAYIYWVNVSYKMLDYELKHNDSTKMAGEFLEGFVGSSLVLLNILNPDSYYWDKTMLYS